MVKIKRKIIIDTNIFVRLLAQDIPYQHKIATDILENIENGKIQGVVPILVIAEYIIICTKFYKISIDDTINYLLRILSMKCIETCEIEKKEIIQILKNSLKYRVDFTDACLLWLNRKESYEISSFDKKLMSLVSN